MGKQEKLLEQLRITTKTFSWSSLLTLMRQLGYEKKERAGSWVRFYHPETGHLIRLYKPHPENHIKGGALKDLCNALREEGYL